MTPTKSIAQVKDLYDLIDLYANLDKNVDGRLGPDEVSAEEINVGDKEGISEDGPDGFLQPWEVMEMRFPLFNPVETFRMRALNRATSLSSQARAFADIPLLPHDVEIKGILYKSGTELSFNLSARVSEGTFAQATSVPSIPGVIFPADSKINSVFFNSYNANPSVVQVILGSDAVVNGIHFPKGTWLQFTEGRLDAAKSAKGFLIDQARFTAANFWKNGHISYGALAEDAPLLANDNRRYTFKSGDGITFFQNGKVRYGKLAEDAPSPYGTGVIAAETNLTFLESGLLLEGSMACFRQLFPRIMLSGSVSKEDILLSIESLRKLSPQMLASIRGIHFTYDEVPTPFARKGQKAYANPFNKTIYLRKGTAEGELDVSTIIHEAAHIRHFALQDEYLKRIAAATRNLDPLNMSDQAEDRIVSERIFARSIDGRWSRAAGLDFHFTISDLIDYMHNFKEDANAKRSAETETPRDGFINSYGRISIWEDIATHVELIQKDIDSYRKLIDPKSDFYIKHPHPDPVRIARIYRDKLNLLFEYGFITEDTYRTIVPMDPGTEKDCRTLAVNCP